MISTKNRMQATQPAGWAATGAAAAVILLGFAMRLHRLAAPSLWLDEMGQATMALDGLRQAIDGARLHNGAAPLDYIFTWLALRLAQNDFVARLPAVVAATLTLAVTYRLGRELFGRTTGLLAALLLAVAPFHLRFSQEVRFYALFALMAAASTLAFVLALRRNTLKSWAVYTAVLVVSLYSHYYIPLLVAAQGIALLAHVFWPNSLPLPGAPGTQHSKRLQLLARFAGSSLLAAIAFLPWMLTAVLQETGAYNAVPPPGTSSLLGSILAALTLNQESVAPTGISLFAMRLYFVLAVVGALSGLWRRKTRLGALLLVVILLATPPAVFVALRLTHYFFAFRQILYLLPFYLILVAWGAHELAVGATRAASSDATRRVVYLATIALAAGILTLSLRPSVQQTYTSEREDWRAALEFVRSNFSAGEAVIVPVVHPPHYLSYYAGDWLGRITGPRTFAEVQAGAENRGAAWIVLIPPADSIRDRLDPSEALPIDFGSGLAVYYWKPGHGRREVLSQAQQWTPPADESALADLAGQFQAAGMAAAADQMQALADTLTNNRGVAFRRLMAQGDAWRQTGQHDLAIAAYKQATAAAPDQDEAWIRLGEQQLLADRPQQAAAALKRALAIDSELFWGHRLLGQAYAAQGRHGQAVDQLNTAVGLEPENADTYYFLGNELAAIDEPQRAASAFEKYLQLAPDGGKAQLARQELTAIKKYSQQ